MFLADITFWMAKSHPNLSSIQSASLYSLDTSEFLPLKLISMFTAIPELLTTVLFKEFVSSPTVYEH